MSTSTSTTLGKRARSGECKGPYRIGITSSIGAGKSTIGKMLEQLGVPVIDTDHLAHELLNSPNPTYEQVLACFGKDLADKPGGPINRKKLAAIVFSNEDARKKLNAIMHPAIRRMTRERIASHDKAQCVAVLVPLLFEVQLESEYHEIWAVLVDPEEQVKRILADVTRGSQTEADVRARIKSQMPQEKKARLADRVIDNSGALDDTRRQVESCLKGAREAARQRKARCEGKPLPDNGPKPKPEDDAANAARNAEYRRILERFGALGTQEALERMGNVATTEHKEATASLSMTVDSAEGAGDAARRDHQHELRVDVHLSVKQKPAPAPNPDPSGCTCGCGKTCRRTCACAKDCGCKCAPPCPPDPPKPPAPCPPDEKGKRCHRRGLYALIAFLAFLFAIFALIW
ncbi:MAG TPA: dephospho-CoA kinase, partial [Candidatus Obscuribacterales bacterium]